MTDNPFSNSNSNSEPWKLSEPLQQIGDPVDVDWEIIGKICGKANASIYGEPLNETIVALTITISAVINAYSTTVGGGITLKQVIAMLKQLDKSFESY